MKERIADELITFAIHLITNMETLYITVVADGYECSNTITVRGTKIDLELLKQTLEGNAKVTYIKFSS
jgi:hypothetical protein